MTDTTITRVHGRRVWDSRGRPDGGSGSATVPAARSAAPSRRPALRADRTKPWTCATAARHSAAWVSQGGRARQQRDLPAAVGAQCAAPGRNRRRTDRARRHAEQVAAGRQRHDRHFDGGPACRGGCAPHAAVRLPRAGQERAHAAARDPDLRRRRARGTARRHPGFHGDGAGRAQLRRGDRHDRRGLPGRRRTDEGSGQAARCCRRGRLLAGVRLQRGSADDADARDRARRAIVPAKTSASRSTSPPRSSAAAAVTGSGWKTANSTATACAKCCSAGWTAIRSCRSRIRWRRTMPRA